MAKKLLHMMRYSRAFAERYVYVASDGWAYERPGRTKVSRYAHDGGTQTDDDTETRLTKDEISEELWKEILHAFISNRE